MYSYVVQTKNKQDISKHTLRAAYSAFTHSNTHTHTHICNEWTIYCNL